MEILQEQEKEMLEFELGQKGGRDTLEPMLENLFENETELVQLGRCIIH